MPSGVILLGGAWILGHLLIVVVVKGGHYYRPALILASMFLLMAYLLKPYTYDLEKYSIYFVTGYIPAAHWHTPHGGFQLDSRDTTGDPFTAYEPGFRWLSRVGRFLLPTDSLMPRYDATDWDFKERSPPRYDAMVLLIMILGAAGLIFSVRNLLRKMGSVETAVPDYTALVLLVILGSIFYFVGSQNAVRQFLGLVMVLLAINAASSRKYLPSILLVLLATMFHRWALIFGIIAVAVTIGLSWVLQWQPGRLVRPFHVTPFEILSLLAGIIALILIKGLAILGVFHVDFPLVGDLKAYVVNQDQYQTYERLGSWLKVTAIIAVMTLSEMVLGVTEAYRQFDIRLLRRAILLFVVPLVIFPEIFARVVYLYWMVEVVFVVWALSSETRRTRVAGVVVFVAYGFAPNVFNVLLGPEWLLSF